MRELSATARADNLVLLSTSVTRDSEAATNPLASALLAPTRVTVELRGPYRNVLAAIGSLSLGSEIVDVAAPSLRRDGDAVIASVPVTIYEPAARGVSPGGPADGAR